jgi:predicted transposase/invertase (TIGR01784 family)
MQKKLLSPKNDYIFHRIFGDVKNKKLLISLLSAILETNIKELLYQSPVLKKERIKNKGCILDVFVITDDNVQANVEMQVNFRKDYINRILLYWAKLYTQQIDKGKKHITMNKTISITILNDESRFFPHFHSVYGIYEEKGNPPHLLTDLFEMHFIDMKRVSKETSNNGLLELWISFLKEENPEVMKMLSQKNNCIGQAYNVIEELSQSKAEWLAAASRENFLIEQRLREDAALKEGREEGIEIGREEGREEGREKGREEGIEIGEKRGQIETAKAMIVAGVDIETVCKATGLTQEELK